ncbi:hypothetical protein [Variovorax sp. DT-64]|uniref:hypothetical protein n=1 Tax=Variovorax sp. DT-64 TaxID=3396160 RepID=UPI003F1C9DA6
MYLSELTYLLFLKMMKETGQEDRLKVWKRPKKSEPPVEQPGTRWDDLLNASAPERLDIYKEMLLDYGLHGRGAVQEIYANANTFITKPATGKTHAGRIDSLGLDENNCPVILEYKRPVGENVINQGLFYLDWLMDHQAEFKLLVMDNWESRRPMLSTGRRRGWCALPPTSPSTTAMPCSRSTATSN